LISALVDEPAGFLELKALEQKAPPGQISEASPEVSPALEDRGQ